MDKPTMDIHSVRSPFCQVRKSKNLRFKDFTPGFGPIAPGRPGAPNRGQGPFRPFEREFRVSLCYAAFFKRRLSQAFTLSNP